MGSSLIYKSSLLYESVMLGLYGRYVFARYRALADLIPRRASVVDLCCGPACLYRRYLRPKSVRYCGVDINRGFVADVVRAGGKGLLGDLRTLDTLPSADYVLMQASLYHFLPDPSVIVERMIRAAGEQVIIAEPVRNLTSDGIPLLSGLAARWTDPGIGCQPHRFTEQTLDEFFVQYSARTRDRFHIAGGREKVYVLQGKGGPQFRTSGCGIPATAVKSVQGAGLERF